MGKASAPAPPDFSPIASSDTTQANKDFKLGEQQLSWAKNQFNHTWPDAQKYLQSEMGINKAEVKSATQQRNVYQNTYLPIEKQFANQASNYNTPVRANQNAASAEADVANATNASRAASLQSLESFGIDPSQTRYSALDLGTRVNQAAATAAAGTQSRLNTQATGFGLENTAINTGRGYPSAINSTLGTATGAGAAGIGAANSTTSVGSSTMGSPIAYGGLGNSANSGATSALSAQSSANLGSAGLNAQLVGNEMSGLGQILGAGAGLFML